MDIYMAGRSGLKIREERWIKILRFRLLSYYYLVELEKMDDTNPINIINKHNKQMEEIC